VEGMIVIAIAAGPLDLLHPLAKNAAAATHISVKITDDCFIEPRRTMSCVRQLSAIQPRHHG
jgi:hypothetical protein